MGICALFFQFNLHENLNILSLNLEILVMNITLPLNVIRIKGPKTPSAPDLTEFQKEVIFGSMLGDLYAEKAKLQEILD